MKRDDLLGQSIWLQPLHQTHITEYLSLFSPIVRNYLHVDSCDSEYTYILERLEKQQCGDTFFYSILLQDTNAMIGALEIRDPKEHKGQLYCWLNEQFWAQGYFQEAIHLAADYYFAITKQLFITVRVDVSNLRSYKALKKCGFADVGKSLGGWGMQYELILRKK
jgi:RimJ/RimL family protein N-acetyltransferase